MGRKRKLAYSRDSKDALELGRGALQKPVLDRQGLLALHAEMRRKEKQLVSQRGPTQAMEGGDALVDAEQAGSSLHVLLDGRPNFDVGDGVTRNLGKRFDPVKVRRGGRGQRRVPC